MFYYIYFLVAVLLHIIATPFLVLFSFKRKYKESIPARFFLYKNRPFSSGDIHFHVCSLGEANSIKGLVHSLSSFKIQFSATTNTGFNALKQYNGLVRYLPFESILPFWIVRQKVLVVLEAELWFMLFATYFKKRSKIYLVNARVSDRSYPKYIKLKWLYAHIFSKIDRVYAQSEIDKIRLLNLGAKDVLVVGNIKFSNISKPTKMFNKRDSLIVCAASTHRGEEKIIVDSFLELKKLRKDSQLIVVPRHPERFEEVYELLEKVSKNNKLTFSKYSVSGNFDSDIILIDAMGELVNIYAISDIVVMGGTFAPIGGHNILEAAQFGVKIISGENFFSQKEIYKAVDGINIVKEDNLKQALLSYNSLNKSIIDSSVSIEKIVNDIKDNFGR